MKLSIVIPNYNGEEIIQKNIPKVHQVLLDYAKSTGNTGEIIINDDFSKDNSMDVLHGIQEKLKNTEIPIQIFQNEKNYGFSTTVNRAVRKASGDLIVLLNTDVNPEKDFLNYLIPHFEDLRIFGVGCMDRSIEGEKTVLRGRGIGKWDRGFLQHAAGELNNDTTLWVSGGSSIFRKSLWDKIGGLDEVYNPFYWEDIDLSYRAQKAGYKVLFEKKSVVIHEHEKGAIKSKFKSSTIQKIAMRNQFFFVWKNITDKNLLLTHIIWLPVHLVRAVSKGDSIFLTGFLKAMLELPKILSLRSHQTKLNKLTDKEVLANVER